MPKTTKLIALLLLMAVLVSALAIPALAAGDESVDSEPRTHEVEDDNGETAGSDAQVLYNRDYSDGWGVYNGVDANQTNTDLLMKEHNFFIDYELTSDYSYNYFARFEMGGSGDGYIQFTFADTPKSKKVYVEFDVMTDDYTSAIGAMCYCRLTGSAANGQTMTLLGISDNKLYAFNSGQYTGFDIRDNWVHVIIEFDYTDEKLLEEHKLNVRVTLDDGENEETVSSVLSAKTPFYTGLDILRIGPQASDASKVGMSFCLDNLRAYQNADRPLTDAEVNAQGYGAYVDTTKMKTETILGQDGSVNLGNVLKDALCMKVGVDYSLFKDKQADIYDGTYGAPIEIDGTVYVPLEEIIEYIGYEPYVHGDSYDLSTGTSAAYITIGRDIATVDGKMVKLTKAPGYHTDPATAKTYPVIAIDDVETLFDGYYATYDNMGLIIICTQPNILNRDTDLDTMIGLMKSFVYNYVTPEELYSDVESNTEQFTHPYLVADQERFDKLIAIYDGTDDTVYDVDLKGGLTAKVKRAYELYEYFALPSSKVPRVDANGDPVLNYDGKQIYDNAYDVWVGFDWTKSNSQKLNQPYTDMGGYDVGGRIGDAGEVMNNWVQDIAFAYAITGDIKLAQLAYYMMVQVGEWDHWGPGHFLNVAEASLGYSLSLDWIYNGIVALEKGEVDADGDGINDEPNEQYSVAYLQDLLWKNGVHMGYLSTSGEPCPWPRPVRIGSDVYFYSTMENNWNSVCSGGMWLASLMLFEREDYRDKAAWLAATNIETIAKYGLDQYAPDGSYVESASYWGYGSNYLFTGLMGLWASAGDDYGILDAPGIDKTCYFACFAESSDYEMFNYHDATEGQMTDSCAFMFMSVALEDPTLAAIRKVHINNGKGFNTRDFLFYPFEYDGLDSSTSLPLDYYMEGIDGFTTRSSWDSGALFAGIIGGDNSASHGQVDSGDFVYHNAGVKWITDLGSEEYNTFGYFNTAYRYRYYRCNAEGNNTLALVSQPFDVPYGQKSTGFGSMIANLSNEHGSYAIIDNSQAYGTYVSKAHRGMLLTNDRTTFVIQDEVVLNGFDTVMWFAHFNNTEVKYDISADGSTMYLYTTDSRDRVIEKVRMTIVSDRSGYEFKVTSCYDFYLGGDKGTVNRGWSAQQGGVAEKSRDAYSRIAITSKGLEFNAAIVFELMDLDALEEPEVGYEWMPMSEWEPAAPSDDTGEDESEDDKTPKRGTPRLATIRTGVNKLTSFIEGGIGYLDRLEDFYYTLTDVEYAIKAFRDESSIDNYATECELFATYKADYDFFVGGVAQGALANDRVLASLMGI